MSSVKTNAGRSGGKIKQASLQNFMLLPGETVSEKQFISYIKGVDPYKSMSYYTVDSNEAVIQPFYLDTNLSFVTYRNNTAYTHCMSLSLSSAEEWGEYDNYSYLSSYDTYGNAYPYKAGQKSFVILIPHKKSSSPYVKFRLYKFELNANNRFSYQDATYKELDMYSGGGSTSYPLPNMACLSQFEGTDILVGSAALSSSSTQYRYLVCVKADTLTLYNALQNDINTNNMPAYVNCFFVPMSSTEMVFIQSLARGSQDIQILTRDSSNNLTLSANKITISYADSSESASIDSAPRGVKLNDSCVLLITEVRVNNTTYTYAVFLDINLSGKSVSMRSKQLLHTKTNYLSSYINSASLAFTKKEANKFTLLYVSGDYQTSTQNADTCTDFFAIEATTAGILRHEKITSGPVGFLSRPIGYLALQTGNQDRRGSFELDYDMLLKNLLYGSYKKSSAVRKAYSLNNNIVTTQPTKSGIAGITKSEGQNVIQLITKGTSDVDL